MGGGAGEAAARLVSTELLVLRTLGAVNNARLIGEIIDSLRKGKPLTELATVIVLAKVEGRDHVILEGCKSRTALLLISELLPPELPVLAYAGVRSGWHCEFKSNSRDGLIPAPARKFPIPVGPRTLGLGDQDRCRRETRSASRLGEQFVASILSG